MKKRYWLTLGIISLFFFGADPVAARDGSIEVLLKNDLSEKDESWKKINDIFVNITYEIKGFPSNSKIYFEEGHTKLIPHPGQTVKRDSYLKRDDKTLEIASVKMTLQYNQESRWCQVHVEKRPRKNNKPPYYDNIEFSLSEFKSSTCPRS